MTRSEIERVFLSSRVYTNLAHRGHLLDDPPPLSLCLRDRRRGSGQGSPHSGGEVHVYVIKCCLISFVWRVLLEVIEEDGVPWM